MDALDARSQDRAPEWGELRSARRWAALLALGAMLFTITKGPLFRLRLEAAPAQGDLTEDAWVQLAFVTCSALVLALAAPGFRILVRDRFVSVAFGLFLGVVLASSLWSVTASRTVQQSTMFLVGSVAALVAGAALRRFDALVALWLAMQVGVGISVFGWWRDWSGLYDIPGNFVGAYFNRNSLGPVAVLGAASAIVVAVVAARRGWWWLSPIALATAVVDAIVWARNGSFTPVVALAVAVGVTVLYSMFVPGPVAVVRRTFGAIGLGAVVVVSAELVVGSTGLVDRLGRQRTWESRRVIWDVVLDFATERPVQGWGFLAVWAKPDIIASLEAAGNDPVFEAHSGYLEVFLGVGLIGLVLLAVLLVASVTRVAAAMWVSPSVLSATSVGVVVYVLAANVSETFIGPNLLPWTLLCVATGQAVAVLHRPAPDELGPDGVPLAPVAWEAVVDVNDVGHAVAGATDTTPAGMLRPAPPPDGIDDSFDFSFEEEAVTAEAAGGDMQPDGPLLFDDTDDGFDAVR